MTSILNHISPPRNAFRPRTADDFFRLQLARKLGEPARLKDIEHFPVETLWKAFRKLRNGKLDRTSFERALQQFDDSADGSLPRHRLCAIKLQRREVAAAVFSGLKLDFVQERHLSSDPAKAESSALGFINWVVSNLEADSAALERIVSSIPTRRVNLSRTALASLRAIPLPVWEVEKKDLLKRFALPAPKTRKEVRGIVSEIWPILNDRSDAILDAVALGLAVQTQGLLS